jgi:hypothetical protein
MIVECIATLPTLPQSVRLGKRYIAGAQEFPVVVGERYDVFGISQADAGCWIFIRSSADYLVSVPLCLFKVVDARVVTEWRIAIDRDGDLVLAFEEMLDPYFIDDLASGRSRALVEFSRLTGVIEAMRGRDRLLPRPDPSACPPAFELRAPKL